MGKLAQQLGGQSQVKVCEKKSESAPQKSSKKKDYKCGGLVKGKK